MDAINSDDIVRRLLIEKCEALEVKLAGEVIMVRAPMAQGIDDVVRREIENIASQDGCRNQLVVVLETSGGSIEVVERISDVFRHHFEHVKFVIPNFAYSAGTVLTLSGDDILMDYYSVLGPIDPQIKNRDDRWVPGLGYLEKYKELTTKANITVSELEFLVRKFDAAELFALEQAKEHSKKLIVRWLCDYKFKDWEHRETSGDKVDGASKRKRAEEIAELLGDAKEWNSHGRGIPLRTLQSDKVKLKITDFGADPDLNRAVREYYDLFIDYCAKIGADVAVHTKRRLWALGGG
jgi:hypothetical protein